MGPSNPAVMFKISFLLAKRKIDLHLIITICFWKSINYYDGYCIYPLVKLYVFRFVYLLTFYITLKLYLEGNLII